ncbi:MAG: hypothetical protein RMJ98_07120 [Myxococcales bacterium]|nr:hypothetical protein [Polyangiaceae bacterium]MDW8249057.1 hypothetical protein [Myxococcales bacterium]
MAKIKAAKIPEAARIHFRGGLLMLVTGHATQLASELQQHGEVAVIDLNRGFEPVRVLPEVQGNRKEQGIRKPTSPT